ncbi:MAG: hypothetical protein ACSHX5_01715 [Phycisphaerales bacterium]
MAKQLPSIETENNFQTTPVDAINRRRSQMDLRPFYRLYHILNKPRYRHTVNAEFLQILRSALESNDPNQIDIVRNWIKKYKHENPKFEALLRRPGRKRNFTRKRSSIQSTI